MLQFHCYPGGKKRVVTFSYDDGPENDKRLVALFNRYGVKGTFHLNGAAFSDERKAEISCLYAGHEVSGHTVRHGWLDKMPAASLISEIMDNRRALEEAVGYPVVGLSYPSGAYSVTVENALRACGVLYSRTTKNTMQFGLPEDFLAWHPTCHHKDAQPLAERFMADLDSEWRQPLFYVWGHSHEFRSEEDWASMEKLVATVAGSEKIWYATNIEIYDYITAVRSVRVSVDESQIFNPSHLDVWVEKDKKEIIKIPAGTLVRM